MITVSEKAKKRISQLIDEQHYDPSYFLRVGVDSGGCSGLSYKLDFDNVLKSGDEAFDDCRIAQHFFGRLLVGPLVRLPFGFVA